MTDLTTSPNILDPDEVYERLIEMHEGLPEKESTRVNARLILILLNHIGDREAIFEAFELASRSGTEE